MRFSNRLENGLQVLDSQGLLDRESPVFCSAQAVQEGAAAQGFAEVAGEGADISAFGAIRGNLKNPFANEPK